MLFRSYDDEASSGLIDLKLSAVPPPGNDNFANRSNIVGKSAYFRANNLGATIETGEAITNGASVWWTWQAPANGGVRIVVDGEDMYGDDMYPEITVYEGSPIRAVGQQIKSCPSRFFFVLFRVPTDHRFEGTDSILSFRRLDFELPQVRDSFSHPSGSSAVCPRSLFIKSFHLSAPNPASWYPENVQCRAVFIQFSRVVVRNAQWPLRPTRF